MSKQGDEVKSRRLSDAYAVPGFRVLQRVDSHEFDRRIFVLTLAQRPKKRRGVAAAENGRTAYTASAGDAKSLFFFSGNVLQFFLTWRALPRPPFQDGGALAFGS